VIFFNDLRPRLRRRSHYDDDDDVRVCDESGSVWNVSTFSCFKIISKNLPAKSKENYEKDNSGYPVF